MSITDLDAMMAEFNKLPSPAYQEPKHMPKPLRQQGISSNPDDESNSPQFYTLSPKKYKNDFPQNRQK